MPHASHDLTALAEPICAAHGVELVDLRLEREPGGQVLRVVIDRDTAGGDTPKSGVTLDDCRQISRDLASALDVHDAIASRYRLEVTSPGLDRPLVKLAHFAKYAGEEAKLNVHAPIDGRRNFRGKLLGVDGDVVRLEQDGKEVRIPHGDIVKANLVFNWARHKAARA